MINNKPIGIFLTMHQLMSSPNGTQPKSLEVPFSQQAVEFTRDTEAYNGLQPEQQATMLHLWTRIRFGLEQLSQMIEDHCPDGAAKLHLAAYRVGFYSDFVTGEPYKYLKDDPLIITPGYRKLFVDEIVKTKEPENKASQLVIAAVGMIGIATATETLRQISAEFKAANTSIRPDLKFGIDYIIEMLSELPQEVLDDLRRQNEWPRGLKGLQLFRGFAGILQQAREESLGRFRRRDGSFPWVDINEPTITAAGRKFGLEVVPSFLLPRPRQAASA